MSNAIVLPKITLKAICGLKRGDDSKAAFAKYAKDQIELVAVAGKVTGYGGKQTQYGESIFLIGSFVAQNRETKAIYKSSKAYLPGSLTEEVVAKFKSRANASDAVEFQATVRVIESDTPTGYQFVCEPFRTPEAISEEAELMEKLAALPAPKKLAAIAGKK